MTPKLKAPFPWFGGKSRCAHLVWQRLGDVPNYVEPFYGSGAVTLGRPHAARTETVNDKDCYLANFWRAVAHDPEAVAHFADWPVNEADLHARHRWLVKQTHFRRRMRANPHYYNAKIAGWWVWGISQWIGSGWCSQPEWEGRSLAGRSPRGIQTVNYSQRPNLNTINPLAQKRPNLGRSGRGTHSRMGQWQTRPFLTGSGQGVHAKMPTMKRNNGSGVMRTEIQSQQLPQQLPAIGGDGSGAGRGVLSQAISANLLDYMLALQDRLRRTRICCGDWKRILGPSPTTCIGLTGVFLDPPYGGDADRDPSIYNEESLTVAKEVAAWALEHGEDPKLRIAVCGYEGEHQFPATWECVTWKANGGYGNQASGKGRANAWKERIWFSPHCLRPEDELFS